MAFDHKSAQEIERKQPEKTKPRLVGTKFDTGTGPRPPRTESKQHWANTGQPRTGMGRPWASILDGDLARLRRAPARQARRDRHRDQRCDNSLNTIVVPEKVIPANNNYDQ